MTEDMHRLLAAALSSLALGAGCAYSGEYGTCDADQVNRMYLAEVIVMDTTSAGEIEQWNSGDTHGGAKEGEDVLVCVSGMVEEDDCLSSAFDESLTSVSNEVTDQIPDDSDWHAPDGACGDGSWRSSRDCGPMWLDEMCCWTYTYEEEEDLSCDGRPFLVRGVPRKATALSTMGWSQAIQPQPVPVALREAVIHRWMEAGRMEHASVAAFARFALVLLHHGAPAALVSAAHRAALDEVRHAELCFGLASAYAGQPLGPGPLNVAGAMDGELDLRHAVRTLAREGCIGETLAALQAAHTARAAADPVVSGVLEQIADDEARHAELAWRALRWLVDRWPSLADLARKELASFTPRLTAGATAAPEHGCLSASEMLRLCEHGLHHIVAPLAAQILGVEMGSSSQPGAEEWTRSEPGHRGTQPRGDRSPRV